MESCIWYIQYIIIYNYNKRVLTVRQILRKMYIHKFKTKSNIDLERSSIMKMWIANIWWFRGIGVGDVLKPVVITLHFYPACFTMQLEQSTVELCVSI